MGVNLLFSVLIFCLFPIGKSVAQDFVEIKLIDSISISFDSGSSIICNPSKMISRIKQTKVSPGKIQLVAYTDAIGSTLYNKSLVSKRLLSVSKLIESINIKGFVLDSTNRNEQRRGRGLNDELFRRVDVLIYSVDTRSALMFRLIWNLISNQHRITL